MRQPILRALLMRYFALSSCSRGVAPGVTSARLTLLWTGIKLVKPGTFKILHT